MELLESLLQVAMPSPQGQLKAQMGRPRHLVWKIQQNSREQRSCAKGALRYFPCDDAQLPALGSLPCQTTAWLLEALQNNINQLKRYFVGE
jgi:hypothetical protein